MEERIDRLVEDFSLENLRKVFEDKLRGYWEIAEVRLDPEGFKDYQDYFEEVHCLQKDGQEEVGINEEESIVIYAIRTLKSLSERSSKKRQFELAKKLLGYADGGFFVFYDKNGNFRFSFVHKIYKGRKTEFSHYKRYTYFVQKGKPYRTFKEALLELQLDSIESIIKAFAV